MGTFLDIFWVSSKNESTQLAEMILEKFFNTVFHATENHHSNGGLSHVCSLVVFDCAIIFVNNKTAINRHQILDDQIISDIEKILTVVTRINQLLHETIKLSFFLMRFLVLLAQISLGTRKNLLKNLIPIKKRKKKQLKSTLQQSMCSAIWLSRQCQKCFKLYMINSSCLR